MGMEGHGPPVPWPRGKKGGGAWGIGVVVLVLLLVGTTAKCTTFSNSGAGQAPLHRNVTRFARVRQLDWWSICLVSWTGQPPARQFAPDLAHLARLRPPLSSLSIYFRRLLLFACCLSVGLSDIPVCQYYLRGETLPSAPTVGFDRTTATITTFCRRTHDSSPPTYSPA